MCTVKKVLREAQEGARWFLRHFEISKYDHKIAEHTIKGGKAEKGVRRPIWQ